MITKKEIRAVFDNAFNTEKEYKWLSSYSKPVHLYSLWIIFVMIAGSLLYYIVYIDPYRNENGMAFAILMECLFGGAAIFLLSVFLLFVDLTTLNKRKKMKMAYYALLTDFLLYKYMDDCIIIEISSISEVKNNQKSLSIYYSSMDKKQHIEIKSMKDTQTLFEYIQNRRKIVDEPLDE